MPRSFQFINKWRLGLLALILVAPLFVLGGRVDAQKRRPAQTGNPQKTSDASQAQKKYLTQLRSSDTTEGSSITIVSDQALNDYSAYRGGDRFYVLIPGADASSVATGFRGRGFADVRVQKRGNDVLLSFRLLAGSTARVSQKFNRLEILVTVPALVAANSTNNTNNGTGGTQTDTSGGTRNASGGNSGTRTQNGAGTSARNSGNASGVTTQGTTSGGQNSIDTNPDSTNTPEGIPVGPDGRAIQPGTTGFPPDTQASPMVTPSATPPDQIAQLQPTPGVPGTSVQAPPTTTVAPPSGTSFGAQVKQNWLFILLAVAVAGLIAWVLFARSRADDNLVERRIEAIRESRSNAIRGSRAEAKAISAPSKAEVAPLVETSPTEVEPEPPGVEAFVAPVIAAAVVADAGRDEAEQEKIEEKELEPVKPVAVEQASEDVASLLAGKSYDEAVIGTQHSAARQMVAAELLAALAGRNIVRHERARDAFIKHGYFDDATRTLRTAESPGERASAARSLGLVRDDSGTPHLVAALEDPSPEVRRAAVESLAEVRDPAAVASLEALRDREKSRKVPSALIQHAIEASVIGRTKLATPSPPELQAPFAPLVSDTASPSSVDSSAPLLVTEEHLPSVEDDDDMIVETPATLEEAEAAQPAEAELVVGQEESSPHADVPLDVAEEVIAPVVMAELVDEHVEITSSEWVDIDVNRPSTSRHTAAPPIAPIEQVETTSLLEDTTQQAVPLEAEPEPVEPVTETVSGTEEPPLLPFGATEAIIAGADSSRSATTVSEVERGLDVAGVSDKEIDVAGEDHPRVPAAILRRLASEETAERAAAVEELGSIGGEDSFREISSSFDDPSPEVRNAAARALFSLNPDRAASFTRALREASPERRRQIGAALSTSGLATEAIGHLMGESREKTYDAFSLLFLMSKAGEVQPLMRAVEEHPNNEVRLAVVKLLALSGQQEILPAFRRLAVRGSLPTEVRSAVMEAIYQISSQSSGASS